MIEYENAPFQVLVRERPIETASLPGNFVPQPLPPRSNPALLYLARLGPGSQRTQRAALDSIAALLTGGRATAVDMPWHLLNGQHTRAVRSELTARYAPTTANRLLAALRGVLEEAWRLGLMDAETYHRAADVENVPWFTSPRGRILAPGEIQALFEACAGDSTPAGVRDAALLTVLYAAGLRRSEVVALDVGDYDPSNGALTVRSTQASRERIVYATDGAARAIERWIMIRGTDPGPLFVPINKGQKILVRDQRMRDQSIYRVLMKRGEQAGITTFSCQDLRRTFISELLESGADISTVQRLAGHCSVVTTQRYDRRSEASRQELARMRNEAMWLSWEYADRPGATAARRCSSGHRASWRSLG
jgi:integrase